MIPELRNLFNANFSEVKYEALVKSLQIGNQPIPFRVAETPVFLPEDLVFKLKKAGDEIIKFIQQPDFKNITERSIPKEWRIGGENSHPHFLTFDFAITKKKEELIPKLIEIQGFPSLYGFQLHLSKEYKKIYQLDPNLKPFYNNIQETEYIHLLKEVIVGKYNPKEVALIDIDAPNQKTAIDFFLTQTYLGIAVLSPKDLFQEENRLYYYSNGEKQQIKRIYNRMIFEEAAGDPYFKKFFNPQNQLSIEWITHPNWFYRISKFTLPYLKNEFIPSSFFLNELKTIPEDLEKYVLKPLFSFGGNGVIIDVKQTDIDAIEDPENWILQEKVNYEPVLKTPGDGVKTEVRLMYLWPDGENPKLCIGLARLSKGAMVGVSHNKNLDWVGGSATLLY